MSSADTSASVQLSTTRTRIARLRRVQCGLHSNNINMTAAIWRLKTYIFVYSGENRCGVSAIVAPSTNVQVYLLTYILLNLSPSAVLLLTAYHSISSEVLLLLRYNSSSAFTMTLR